MGDDIPAGIRSGFNAFRLMPEDDLFHAPSSLDVSHTAAGGTDALLGYEYAPGWRWEVEVSATDDAVTMAMHNVVPDGDDGPGGRYVVMQATWT